MIFSKKIINKARGLSKSQILDRYLDSEALLNMAVKNDDKKAYKKAMKIHREIEAIKFAKDYYGKKC